MQVLIAWFISTVLALSLADAYWFPHSDRILRGVGDFSPFAFLIYRVVFYSLIFGAIVVFTDLTLAIATGRKNRATYFKLRNGMIVLTVIGSIHILSGVARLVAEK